MTPTTMLSVNLSAQDLHHMFEAALETAAEGGRQDERRYIIDLLHSNDGVAAITGGGLATSLLLERLTILIEQGAWKQADSEAHDGV